MNEQVISRLRVALLLKARNEFVMHELDKLLWDIYLNGYSTAMQTRIAQYPTHVSEFLHLCTSPSSQNDICASVIEAMIMRLTWEYLPVRFIIRLKGTGSPLTLEYIHQTFQHAELLIEKNSGVFSEEEYMIYALNK